MPNALNLWLMIGRCDGWMGPAAKALADHHAFHEDAKPGDPAGQLGIMRFSSSNQGWTRILRGGYLHISDGERRAATLHSPKSLQRHQPEIGLSAASRVIHLEAVEREARRADDIPGRAIDLLHLFRFPIDDEELLPP